MDNGINKLVEVVASGIGSIAGPLLAPWIAKKESKARLIEAEGNANVLSIVAQAQEDAFNMLDTNRFSIKGEVEMGEKITQRIEYQERKRQANICAVVEQAAQQLQGTIVPAVEPNHDWTARFFREVQDVSSEEMQSLWSRVLTGEVKKPGTTSMRTLTILKDLDERTARLFLRSCSAAVYLMDSNGEFFDARVISFGGDAAQNSLANFGLGFEQLNRLNEYGLIIADYNSYYELVVFNEDFEDTGGSEIYHQGVAWDWAISQAEGRRNVRLLGVGMTVAGCELSRVVTSEPMKEYTDELRSFLLREFGVRMRQI